MFTGIIETTGTIESVVRDAGAMRIAVRTPWKPRDIAIGESIACDGICLTVCGMESGTLAFDLSHETLAITTAARWDVGRRINLERALQLGERLGGHMVQGHVDGTGRVTAVDRQPSGTTLSVEVPASLARFVLLKGSITLDGVSLTITAVDGRTLSTVLVPHTLAVTNIDDRQAGDAINVEGDLVGKWIAQLVTDRQP
jgi:riboflavin synthase